MHAVITEFVAGWIWPGKPLANVTFKCMGYMCMLQSLDLSADQKLGLCVVSLALSRSTVEGPRAPRLTVLSLPRAAT